MTRKEWKDFFKANDLRQTHVPTAMPRKQFVEACIEPKTLARKPSRSRVEEKLK